MVKRRTYKLNALPIRKETWMGRLVQRYRKRGKLARLLISGTFVILTVLLLPRNSQSGHDYVVGNIWQEDDLTAPFDFPIQKSAEALQQEKQTILADVHEVFLLSNQAAQHLDELRNYFAELEKIDTEDLASTEDSIKHQISQLLSEQKAQVNATTLLLVKTRYPSLQPLQERALAIANYCYRLAFIDKNPNMIAGHMVSLRRIPSEELLLDKNVAVNPASLQNIVLNNCRDLSPEAVELITLAVRTYVKPNFRYDHNLTQQEQQVALDQISPIAGKIRKGDIIIRRGEMVTSQKDQEIRSLYAVRYMNNGWSHFLSMAFGQFILVILLTVITTVFIRLNRSELHRRLRKMAMLFFTYLFMVALLFAVDGLGGNFLEAFNVNLYYAVPLSMAAILVTVFFDDRVGFLSNILVASLAAVANNNNFEIFFIQFVAGSIAVFNLKFLRKRQQFFLTSGVLLAAYITAYLGYQLYLKGSFTQINYQVLVLLVMNVFFTLATYPVIYIVERIFRIVSDLTYMELLDGDHPLLKDLAVKAPGTYQHSLQVATLAEEAAKKIGANALQVHAAALFHDIGKIFQPEYFTENRGDGPSPHLDLPAEKSAEIIISHVTLGETLARDYKLPEEIIDFIRTHHGYSRVEFFYHKYLKENPDANGSGAVERMFRYPGPLPTTKEQSIVMIADSCEAAARSLDNPTKEALEALVERIVATKINDNQLILASLTFRDVTIIKREIVRILTSIYHSRVKYPDQVTDKRNPITD
ncbi:MAG: HDIG domain-containing protein [Bacteroidetes bacterium]|nr:HDIG domain-containing protein [Bacteroidota bacterium]